MLCGAQNILIHWTVQAWCGSQCDRQTNRLTTKNMVNLQRCLLSLYTMQFIYRSNVVDSRQGVESSEQLSSFEKRQEKVRLHFYFICVMFYM